MSSNNRDRRKITTSLLLVVMFLFADLALPQAIPEWPNEELEEENASVAAKAAALEERLLILSNSYLIQ